MVSNHAREPWNKGKLIGLKPPLKPKDIWAIRIQLQNLHQIQDLAMFNLAIDSKLNRVAAIWSICAFVTSRMETKYWLGRWSCSERRRGQCSLN